MWCESGSLFINIIYFFISLCAKHYYRSANYTLKLDCFVCFEDFFSEKRKKKKKTLMQMQFLFTDPAAITCICWLF